MIKDVEELAIWPEIPKDVFEKYKKKGDSTMNIFIDIMIIPSSFEKEGVNMGAYDYNKLCNSQNALLAFQRLLFWDSYGYTEYFGSFDEDCKDIFNSSVLNYMKSCGAEKLAALVEEGIILYDTYKDEIERLKGHTWLEFSGTYQMIKEEFDILTNKIDEINFDSEKEIIKKYVEEHPSRYVKIIG